MLREKCEQLAVSGQPAQLTGVDTPAAFVAALRNLRGWSGLTYRQLENRSREVGRHLARSTIASALSRDGLPRAEFVASFVRVCGAPPEPWLQVRRDIAGGVPTVTAGQLPSDVAHLVGRDRELSRLVGLLSDPGATRRVTVVSGQPGVGKSALAIRAAHLTADAFPDGRLYVDLLGTTPDTSPLTALDVVHQLLRMLGCAEADLPVDLPAATARLRGTLAGRKVLVLLDNAQSAAQVRPLSAFGVTLAVTARGNLTSLPHSRRLHLAPLSQPDATEVLAELLGTPAPDRPAVGCLAALCAGVPLALHLAAARLTARPTWPVTALVTRMADQDRLLDELHVDDLSTRASIAISYESLRRGEDDRAHAAAHLFCHLGALPNDDVAAEEMSCPEVPAAEHAMEALVDSGLAESPEPGRYRVPRLVWLYAREIAVS